jgi:hypothetical protein
MRRALEKDVPIGPQLVLEPQQGVFGWCCRRHIGSRSNDFVAQHWHHLLGHYIQP